MEIAQVEKFEHVVTRIFKHLLDTFPQKIPLDATVAGYKVIGGDKLVIGEHGMQEFVYVEPGADEVFFNNCARWLAQEGFISFHKDEHVSFSGTVLTRKGLDTVGATPACLLPTHYL